MTANIRKTPAAPRHFAVIAVYVMCSVSTGRAFAQSPDQPRDDSPQVSEEIVVTGSRIVKRDFSSPSPISTIDRTTLSAAAQPTVEELLNQMPQITPDFERTANNPGDGTARVNLRGLGSNRTLVLLNGRRLAPSGVNTAVDVNNLPQSLIDKVEIVTGGATTVYGSDAVAGVVNFITRDNFDGLDVDATAYVTEEGDANVYDLNLSFGHNFANGNGNVSVYAGYYDRSDLFASERTVSAVPIEDMDGVLTEGGSLTTPSSVITFPLVDFGNGPANTTFDASGLPVEFNDPADRYNFATLAYLQTPLMRTSTGVFFNYEVGENNEIYAEISYTRNESEQSLAPVPARGFFLTNLDNPLLNAQTQQFFASNFAPPFLPPGTAGLFIARRLEELGPRLFDITRDYSRVAAGIRGEFDFGWDYDVWMTYTDNDEESLLRNGASESRLQQGLFVSPISGACFDPSDGCTPLNIWGVGNLSAIGADFLRLPTLANTTSREQMLISGYVRGSPLDTWAGAVEMAFGAEWRDDEGTFRSDPLLLAGDALGFRGTAGVDGQESVYEVYTEAVIPLLDDAPLAKRIELELGARFSDYDNVGSVWTYKLGGNWQLTENLRLRAMFQHSVRAPNLAEAFQEQFIEPGNFVRSDPSQDPCSASADPVGNGNVEACVATGLPRSQIGIFEATVGVPTDFVRGGNPDLSPEEADTFTAGIVATFGDVQTVQLSVDYFDLEIEDTIGDIVATVTCFDPANTANLFCDKFTRDPNNFNVIELINTKFNRGGQRTTGFDSQLAFKTVLPSAAAIIGSDASFSADLVWTHTNRNDTKELPFGTSLRCVGQFGFPCNAATDGITYPEDRVSANVSYVSDNLGLFLRWRWVSGTDNAQFLIPDFLGTPVPNLTISSVGSRGYVDLGASYQFSNNVRARLNVSNLFDRSPPLLADAVVSNNTDTRLYDVFGRSYSLTLSLRY